MGCGLSADEVNEPGIKWISQLDALQNQLKKSNVNQNIFGNWFWSYLFTRFKKFSMNTTEKLQFLSYLQKLLQFNYGIHAHQNQKSFDINDAGAKFHKLENHLYFKHKRAYNYFKFISNKKNHPEFEKELLLTELNFDLSEKQILEVAAKVRTFCQDDLDAFAFLSLYLQIAVTKGLEKKPLKQQQAEYSSMLKFLQTVYPANNNKVEGEDKSKENNKDQNKEQDKQQGIKQNKDQNKNNLNTIVKGAFQKFKIKSNYEFEEVKYDDGISHYDKLRQFILQKAEQAKKAKSQFEKLVKGICYEKGYGFKSGVKIKSAKNQESIFRTVQKLVEKKFKLSNTDEDAVKKTYSKEQIQDFIKDQKKLVYEGIKDLIEKECATKFEVKDLLRGKCTFDKIEDLVETAQKLIDYIQQSGESYEIIEIKNKLHGKTKDLVSIIKLNSIVVELQLVLKLDSVSNEFNHKIYELIRSTLYSPIPNLFVHTQKWCKGFFIELFELYQNMMSYNKVLKSSDKIDIDFKNFQLDLLYFKQHFLIANGISERRIGDGEVNDQVTEKIKELINMINENEEKDEKQNCSEIQRKLNEVKFINKCYDFNKANQILRAVSNSDLQKSSQIMFVKAEVEANRNKINEALESYIKCLQIRVKTIGPQSVEVANTLLSIGVIYTKKADYKQALQNYNKSLAIKVKILGSKSIQVATTMQNVGIIYQKKGDWKLALQNFQKSLDIKTKKFGLDSVDAATTLNFIGNVYATKGEYDEALQKYNKCLDIRTKVLGPDSVDVATTLNNIGIIYGKKKVYDKAFDNYQKCLAIRTKIMGVDSADVAQTFNNIGVLFSRQNQYEKALECFKKSIQICKKIHGANSIDGAQILQTIGNMFRTKGDMKEALENYKKSLEIKSKIQPEPIDISTTYSNIAGIYMRQKNYKQAVQHYQRSAQIKIKTDPESNDILSTLHIIAEIYWNLSDFGQSIEFYNKCLQIELKKAGQQNVENVAAILNNLGNGYWRKGDLESALESFKKCLEIRINLLGPDAQDVQDIREHIEIIARSKADMQKALMKSSRCFDEPPKEQEAPQAIDVAQIFANLNNL